MITLIDNDICALIIDWCWLMIGADAVAGVDVVADADADAVTTNSNTMVYQE